MRSIGWLSGYPSASHSAYMLLQPGRRFCLVVRVRPKRFGHRTEIRPRTRQQVGLVHELAPHTPFAAQDQTVLVGYSVRVAPVVPQPIRPVVNTAHLPAAGQQNTVTGLYHLQDVKN